MPSETILIVEDDGILAMHLQDTLAGQGYSVLEPVATGEAAIAAVAVRSPDLILMDIELAGEMNGITAAERIRAVSDIPIVFLTGYSQDPLVKKAKNTAPYGYLIKPVPERELAVTVEIALYRHVLDKKLQESEEKYRLISENAGDVIWTYDLDSGRFIYVSPSVQKLRGFSPAECMQQSMQEVLTPESYRAVAEGVPKRLAALAAGDETARVWVNEIDQVRRDGSVVHTEAVTTLMTGPDGRVNTLLGVSRDITERKRVEEALRESEDRFRELFGNMSSAVAIYDAIGDGEDFIFKDINPACERYEKCSKDQIVGKSVCEAFPGVKEFGLLDVFQRVWRSGLSEHFPTHLYKDQRIEGWRENFVCKLPSGEIAAIYEDVTARIQADMALREKTEEIERYFSTSLDLFVIADTDGYFRRLNPQWEATLGHKLEELEGCRFLELVHPDDREATSQAVSRLAAQEAIINFVNRYRCKDGSYRWIEWRATPKGKQIFAAARDITERKQAEAALQQQREELQTILDSVPALIFYKDPDNRVVRVNRAWAETLGLSQGRMPGTSLYDVFPRDAAERLHREDKLVIESGRPLRGISEVVETAQGTRHFLTDKVPFRNEKGDVIGVIGLSRDITDRKRAEVEAVARAEISQLFLQSVSLETIYQGLAECLVATLGFPIAAIELHDREQGEMILVGSAGMPEIPVGLRVPVDQTLSGTVATSGSDLCETQAGRRSEYQFEQLRQLRVETFLCVPFQTGDEVMGTVALADQRSRSDAGLWLPNLKTIAALLSLGIRRKRAEDQLRESTARLETAVRASNVGLWSWDLKTNKVYYSPEWKRQIGYEDREISDTFSEWQSRVHPDDLDRALHTVNSYLKNPWPDFENEFRFRHKDGSYRWILTRASLLCDDEGVPLHMLGAHVDITDRKQAEEERRRMEDRLRQVQKLNALGELAAGVAHDFNNLLTVMRGNAFLALESAAAVGEIQEPLEMIQQSIDRASDMTRSLLAFGRSLPSERKECLLGDVLQEALRLIRYSLPRQIDLETEIACDMACRLMVDRTQFQQVLLNLAINARDAMPQGGKLRIAVHPAHVADAAHSRLSPCPGESSIRITIADNGTGIPSEVLPRIFEPFFSTKPRGKGTGLGLSIVSGIIEEHGGTIGVDSEIGVGTTFRVDLPCQRAGEGNHDVARSSAVQKVQGHGELVLVTSEDPYLRGSIAGSLRSVGYSAVAAAGHEALPTLIGAHRSELRLVVSDAARSEDHIPDMLRDIRSVGRDLPVVFLVRSSAIDEGGLDAHATVMSRPFMMADLMERVHAILEGDPTESHT